MENGGCDHICVSGFNGQYHCRCRPGFRLKDDGKSCEGKFYYEVSIWALQCTIVSLVCNIALLKKF